MNILPIIPAEVPLPARDIIVKGRHSLPARICRCLTAPFAALHRKAVRFAAKQVFNPPSAENMALGKIIFENFLNWPYFNRAPFHPERYALRTEAWQIDTVLFRNVKANGPAPTILVIQGNNSSYQYTEFAWLAQLAAQRNLAVNIAVFDLPGVGDSLGKCRTEEDALRTTESVIQFIQRTLLTPKSQIHLYGRSLGGAIAAIVKARDPELTGDLIADRSPRSMSAVIAAHAGRPIASLVSGLIEKLQFSAERALQDIANQGTNWVFYHPNDRIVPPSASLARTAQAGIRTLALEARGRGKIDYHNEHLVQLDGGFSLEGRPAQERIFSEIFRVPQLPPQPRASVSLIEDHGDQSSAGSQ